MRTWIAGETRFSDAQASSPFTDQACEMTKRMTMSHRPFFPCHAKPDTAGEKTVDRISTKHCASTLKVRPSNDGAQRNTTKPLETP